LMSEPVSPVSPGECNVSQYWRKESRLIASLA
jgi:hypothetical protein